MTRTISFLAVCVCGIVLHAEDFTQFRGSLGNGVAPEQDIPLEWSAEKNVAWQISVPGSGWSQPIVLGNRVFVTAAVSESAPKPANYSGGMRSPQSMGITLFAAPPKSEIDWKVFCLDADTGTIVWERTAHTGKAKYSVHPSNSYATESPVADENGIYAYFGAAGIVAGLNLDGTVRWTQDVGVYPTTSKFGTGSSLAIHEGKIYAQVFSEETADVYCFAAGSGDELWKTSRKENATSWSTPLVWQHGKGVELIISGENRVDSLHPETGEILWTAGNVKSATASSVCSGHGMLFFGASDPFSKGPLFAVKPGGQGDISPSKKNEKFESCVWLQEKQGPGMSSPVCGHQCVYTTDNNILKCFDAFTGNRHYQMRIPGLKMVAASPLIIGDKLLLLDEGGNACIAKAGPEFTLLGKGQLDDTFWSTPAVADGCLYLRGVQDLYCVKVVDE